MAGLLDKLGQTWPAQMAKGILDAVQLPGQVAGGLLGVQPSQPGMWSDIDEARQQANQSTMMNRAADLGGLVMGGSYAAAPAMKNATGMGIRAYHGSPHDFDRFDLSKIGTGEGAQAYGHGLYFAEREGVAKAYRDNLSPSGFRIGTADKPITSQNLAEFGFNDLAQNEILSALRNYGGDYNAAIAAFNKRMPNLRPQSPQWNAILDATEFLKAATGKEVKPASAGRMYEVNINARPEQFLDWDKPLAQTPEVRAKLEPIGFGPNMTGEDIYKKLVGSARPGMGGGLNSAGVRLSDMPPVEVSGRMNATGIPGIKYLDQGSRGAGEGSRNYVVFDDKLIDILRKYGLLGTLGGTGAMSLGNEAQAAP